MAKKKSSASSPDLVPSSDEVLANAEADEIVAEKNGDQPVIEHSVRKPKEELAPLPPDKTYVLTAAKNLRIGGHAFEKGEELARITCRFGLLPRMMFEHVGRLYSIKEVS